MSESGSKIQTTDSEPLDGLYICLLSVHGLIRNHDLELGRDSDTGGQILYVVELARALADMDVVSRVELMTRQVSSPEISPDYAQPLERMADNASIVRIPAGPPDYMPKEQLWDLLDNFVDNAIEYLRAQERLPDLLHSHYADAGYVGSRLSHTLGIPLIHTGHSLGRVKRRRLLASGLDHDEIEQRYNMSRRIEAEETTLAVAERVITSTRQEIEEQYGLYDFYAPEQMHVIPPGTDLSRFHPASGDEWQTAIGRQIRRFLDDPDKPIVLALSRPDPRKNIIALLQAFGGDPFLRKRANLVIIAGNRDDITDMDTGSREVLTELLLAIDQYDLYGRIAYPKHHKADDVPVLYRLAAASGGVFVNPALTEPFGLTLIEAAASGLPIVATEDGGPRDIIANCGNGMLIDPLDPETIADALHKLLRDPTRWQRFAEHGQDGVKRCYTWESHAKSYLELARPIAQKTSEPLIRPVRTRRQMLHHDRAIFTDIDQNLLGDPKSLAQLVEVIRANRQSTTFGIATGRRLDSALKIMRRHGIPDPDVLITSAGAAIHYAPKLTEDAPWRHHIEKQWTPSIVRKVLDNVSGLLLQPRHEQSHFKISYFIDTRKAPSLEEIHQLLQQEEQSVNVNIAFGQFLDVLPMRASKGLALRYVAARWNIPLEQILVAGGSGADEDMMRGNTLAVVVANRHHEELSQLEDIERIYYAQQRFAAGILEAIRHYDFFDSCQAPAEAQP